MKDNSYESRRYILSGVVLLIFITYIVQLFSLQIDNEDYKSKADSNAFYKKTLYPSRGQM